MRAAEELEAVRSWIRPEGRVSRICQQTECDSEDVGDSRVSVPSDCEQVAMSWGRRCRRRRVLAVRFEVLSDARVVT